MKEMKDFVLSPVGNIHAAHALLIVGCNDTTYCAGPKSERPTWTA